MRKTPSLVLGGGLGALTGLCVIALSYLAEQLAGLPFFPFTLFDWLARVLPGGVITLGIDAMVRIIVAFGLGPIDAVAKSMEQLQGMVLWLVLSAVIGVFVAAWIRSRGAGAGRQAGAIAGTLLSLLALVALIGLSGFGATGPLALLWLAILVPGWGAVLGALLDHAAVLSAAAPVVSAGLPSAGAAGSMPASETAVTPAQPLSGEPVPEPAATTGAEPVAPSPAAREPAAAPRAGREAAPRYDRRAFLARAAGGSLLLAAAAGGLGRLLAADKGRTGAGQPLGALDVNAAGPSATSGPAANGAIGTVPRSGAGLGLAATPAPPSGRLVPAPGTRPEITPTADFYRIDINLVPPTVQGPTWQLKVSGLFDRPRNLTLNDLLAMPAVTQPITQSCISNPIGGDLISSAYYTGVRLVGVLQELGLRPEAKELAIRSADGFYEAVEMQDLQDPRVLLVYGMNDVTLPVEHGYPLRIYIPNRYGMKQPKWITSMEAIDHAGRGYWVDRGWSAEARPQVISIIDSVAKDQVANGRVPVGGIAWAGDRGIKSVEVQVDSGEWAAAELRTPPVGPLAWVQWRYDWPVTPGRHTFRARATDGKGAVQIGQDADTYPNGATGYHSITESF